MRYVDIEFYTTPSSLPYPKRNINKFNKFGKDTSEQEGSIYTANRYCYLNIFGQVNKKNTGNYR